MVTTLSPAHSVVTLGNTLIVSLEEARDWIGMFSDDSEDDMVQSLVEAAEKRVRELSNGFQLSEATVIDYYPLVCKRMLLSTRPVIGDVKDVSVSYYNDTEASVDIAQGNFHLDTTCVFPAVVFPDSELTHRLSRVYKNPVSVQYSAGLESPTDKQLSDLKFGLRRAIWIMYNSRNEEHHVDMDAVLLNVLSAYNLGIG